MRWLLVAIAALLSGCAQTKEAEAPDRQPEYFRADPATAGALHGKVSFTGKAPAPKRISMDAEKACQEMQDGPVAEQTVQKAQDGALRDAFVYIQSGLEGKKFEPATAAVVLDQKGCRYVPRVIALQSGQPLTVRNSDPVSHNIHPMPQNNRDWNQQQPPGAADLKRKFMYPEVMIPVKCNVHAWMKSYIGVLDHPFFAVTGDNGEFAFTGLPAGEYVLAAWHETLGEITQKVRIGPKQTAEAALVFEPSARR